MKGGRTMEKDLICGMEVDPAIALKSEYDGKTYYFCSVACKDAFEKEPTKYAKKESGGSCCCGG
jgi:YHS domain-containing protein